ncbi:MAG: type II toxin-antitoxin system VapC family toxin [Thermomicrobiales bacterium]
MTYRILADTGPLLASVDRRDQYHARCRLEQHRLQMDGAEIVATMPTLFECHALLVRRLGPLPAIRWLLEIRRSIAVLPFEEEDLTLTTRLMERYADQPISLFDAAVAVFAVILDVPVWTYDHHFDVMGVPVWR